MKILIVIPTQIEYDLFLKNCVEKKFLIEETTIGRLPVIQFPDLEMTLAHGGLGKVQFAIHTQHLLDSEPGWDLVMCVGAAGALTDDLSIGDIVVAAETIEHDIKNEFGEPLMPRYKGDETAIETLRGIGLTASSFKLHFGSIASGDEDVVDAKKEKGAET